ncbi:hypothetical protein [Streptomyces sp. NPDC029041]|uniref:hypothetical protein n=1 Tax=Streptomyces sp. NPDC029041 TaxID=3155727 RepID=UPI0033ECB9F4
MQRVIDLDEGAAAVAARQPAWQAAGLTVGPLTWRDEAAPRPQRLETDRSKVSDPDSIGIHLRKHGRAAVADACSQRTWNGSKLSNNLKPSSVIRKKQQGLPPDA